MSQGALVTAGWAPGTAWDDAFVPATTIIPLTNESIARQFQQLRSQALVGKVATPDFSSGIEGNTGSLGMDLDYNNLGILEYAMGDLTTGTYSFTDDLQKWFHIEIDKIVKRYRYAGCMVNSFSITADSQSENPLQFTPEIVARSLALSDTAIASLTDTPARAYWKDVVQGYVRLGAHGAALTSGDDVGVTGFEVQVDNNLQTDLITTTDDTYYHDPIRNGHRSVSLKLNFGRLNADFHTNFSNDDRMQAEIYIDGGADGTIKLQFPNMKITGGLDFPVSGPGVMTGEIMLEAFYNGTGGGAINSDMAVEDQMEIVVT